MFKIEPKIKPINQKYLYMYVSDDEFELPLIVADSAKELAAYCGCSTNTIHSSISHQKKDGRKSRYVRVLVKGDKE